MRTFARSFAGGEITPEMFGRLDTSKFQTGVALAKNFTVLPHGPLARRPGFEFIAEAAQSERTVRLIPFQFSADQSAVLEFGDLYIRFHINGNQLLENSKAVVSIVGSTVTVTAHGYVTGDDVFIGGRYHRITSTGANTFTTADRWGVATVATGTTAARVYTLVSPYASEDLFDLHYAQDSDVLTIVSQMYAARELRRLSATNWTLATISFAPSGVTPTGLAVTPTIGTAGNQSPQRYTVTSIGADGITESLPATSVGTNNNLSVAGNFNTVSWSAAAGATRYNVYKQRGGSFGYIGSTTTLSIVDDNVLADTLKTPPANIYTLNTSANNYPAAVTYYEQRRWFAGTVNEPQTVWATRTGTEANLTSSIPSLDDDGLKFAIKARQQNNVRHLLPLSDMIALTVGAEFRIFADSAPSITPTSLSTKPQGYSGASNVQPALTSGSILYVQAQGSRIREMAYNWQSNAYTSIDISIMAPHLVNNLGIVDMAYCRAPVPALWCTRNDGTMIGMTYVPEQQVYAWHQHNTDGIFVSVCCVSEGREDVLYALVRRVINGRICRYVERLTTRTFATQADAKYVDSFLTYASTTAASTISGLWHLEGKTVQVLTEGAVHPSRVVAGGAIALDAAYTKVQIGLPYVSDMQTLPLALETAAVGQGMEKNVSTVSLRVHQSSTVSAGPTFGDLTAYPARNVLDPYGSAPALKSEELRFDIAPDWNSDGAICVRQTDPLPLTVLSIAADVAVSG
jgi:hypothetical protein